MPLDAQRSSSKDLRICAWNAPPSAATSGPSPLFDSRTLPLSDLIKLFSNVGSLFINCELQLASTAERLLASIPVNNSPAPPIALFPQLTTLMLDFSGLHNAKGFGASEMTTLFRHLRLYNLQTLRIKLRPTDTEDLEDGKQ